MRELTEDERFLIGHITRWGSDGYPLIHRGRGWTWGEFRSIKGCPKIFKTKREAVASFESYHEILLDILRAETVARATLTPQRADTQV